MGHRCGSDPSLLWLWCRPVAAAPIQPLAWELPYTAGAALKKKKKRKKEKKRMRLGEEVLEILGARRNHAIAMRQRGWGGRGEGMN